MNNELFDNYGETGGGRGGVAFRDTKDSDVDTGKIGNEFKGKPGNNEEN